MSALYGIHLPALPSDEVALLQACYFPATYVGWLQHTTCHAVPLLGIHYGKHAPILPITLSVFIAPSQNVTTLLAVRTSHIKLPRKNFWSDCSKTCAVILSKDHNHCMLFLFWTTDASCTYCRHIPGWCEAQYLSCCASYHCHCSIAL